MRLSQDRVTTIIVDTFTTIFSALWHQDVMTLKQIDLSLLYLSIGLLIFIKSALVPAAPLPCDSIIILSGSLAALGALNLTAVISLLVIAAWLGSAVGFYQGNHIKDWHIVASWMDKVPERQKQKSDVLLAKYGALAIFIARFIPMIRTLLPIILGMQASISVLRFLSITLLSATGWISLLVLSGYSLSLLPTHLSRLANSLLMIAPLMTLTVAMMTLLTSWVIHKRNRRGSQ